jgi:membrane protease YdiL (CAAX protease family)
MPPLPTPPPMPQGDRPGITAGVWLAWIVSIAAAAVMIATANGFREKAQSEQRTANPQLDMSCRYTVGFKLMSQSISTAPPNMDKLVDQVSSKAITPLDRFRIIPVLYELEGRDQAQSAALRFAFRESAASAQLRDDASALEMGYQFGRFDRDELEGLKKRYGWYGQLAASQIDPSDTAARQAAVSAARLTLITILCVVILGGMFLFAGVVLLVLYLAGRAEGKYPVRFAPADPAASDVLAEAFAIYLSLMAAISILGRDLTGRHPALILLLLLPVAAPLVWLRVRGVWGATLAEAIGWNAGQGFVREIFAGILGYITGMPLIVVGFGLFMFLTRFTSVHATHPIEFEISEGGWIRLLLLFLACVFAPVTEELMFRGMLLRQLTVRWPRILAAIVVSVVFAAIHPQGWTALPVLASIGFVLAMIRIHRNSLVASMAAHAFNNALLLTVLILAAG